MNEDPKQELDSIQVHLRKLEKEVRTQRRKKLILLGGVAGVFLLALGILFFNQKQDIEQGPILFDTSAQKTIEADQSELNSSSDNLIRETNQEAESSIPSRVSSMPAFPGGKNSMSTFLRNNMQYPPNAREKQIQGTVQVHFLVKPDGSLDKIRLVKGIGYGCDEEALRLIKSMPPWIPGYQNGKPIAVSAGLMIDFRLRENLPSTEAN